MQRLSAILFLAIHFLLLAVFSGTATAATALNGIWSNSAGGYLVMLEQSAGGGVVIFQVDPALAAGKAYLGSRSGDTISAHTLDQSASFSATVGGTAYSGTLTSGGGTQTIGGDLLFAYVGGAYDGVWQRTATNDRYLAVVTATIDQAAALVVIDARLDTTTYALTYDVALGALVSSSTPTFTGRSLLSGNTVVLAFNGGNPATATYTVRDTARPPQQVEQFSATQVFAVGALP